ncbi:MAG: ferritin-like domain-containing protein [Chitinophagaceae bacterium]
MQTSHDWIIYFRQNLQEKRIDWTIEPNITAKERAAIVRSMQAWQLGETSDGANLLVASKKYADKIGDELYCEAVKFFIKEEQKHGNNLGRYLDLIQEKRLSKDWGDSLFRKIRHFNTSMQWWTLAVITVESAAQVYYQALKDATGCTLLKQICTDILIDEAYHIDFQMQRLSIIFCGKPVTQRIFAYQFYRLFYFSTSMVVWMGHRKLFKAGNVNFWRYCKKMNLKFRKTIDRMYNNQHLVKNQKEILSINH